MLRARPLAGDRAAGGGRQRREGGARAGGLRRRQRGRRALRGAPRRRRHRGREGLLRRGRRRLPRPPRLPDRLALGGAEPDLPPARGGGARRGAARLRERGLVARPDGRRPRDARRTGRAGAQLELLPRRRQLGDGVPDRDRGGVRPPPPGLRQLRAPGPARVLRRAAVLPAGHRGGPRAELRQPALRDLPHAPRGVPLRDADRRGRPPLAGHRLPRRPRALLVHDLQGPARHAGRRLRAGRPREDRRGHERGRRGRAVPGRGPRGRPGGPARAPRADAVAAAGHRPRLVAGHAARRPARDLRVLAHRVRLAPAGGAAERAAPVPHRDRRGRHPLHPRALARAGRDAAGDDPRLARVGAGVPRRDRAAHRPGGARRRRRRTPSTS